MCAIDECTPWDVYSSEARTARKDRSCTECHRQIRRGEPYEYATGKLCGETRWDVYALCQHCDAATYWINTMCGGWPYGDLGSELREHYLSGYSSIYLARLAAGVRLGWLDGRMPVPDADAASADAERLLERQVA
ncbi:MAG: hypothetical protein H0U62_12530 [Actinobacteria bacterium]|nr:hypothetical protein [Actinomycetota bacterium]